MGFLSGILLDIFYGYSGVIGMNGILFMYLGYLYSGTAYHGKRSCL